jgi:hypothetical protein
MQRYLDEQVYHSLQLKYGFKKNKKPPEIPPVGAGWLHLP